MKTAKRFAMLAGLALALMTIPSFAGCSKKGETAKAAPERHFEFKLSEDGTFIAITKYKGNAKNLVIPETIQGIPVEVIGGFEENEKIESVVIPSSVKVIMFFAFKRCESLKKVTLPEGLLYIANGAFYKTGLTSVTLPKNLEYLGDYVFEGCDNLAEINIPDDAAFLLKNATEYTVYMSKRRKANPDLDWIFTDRGTLYGDSIFTGSKIDESVTLKDKVREITCRNPELLDLYPKDKEKYKKYDPYI